MTLLGEGDDGGCADWFYASCLLLCPFDSAWCLVCELCRLTAVWVDCRCFLSFVFLGGARRLELSPCNTSTSLLKPQSDSCRGRQMTSLKLVRFTTAT